MVVSRHVKCCLNATTRCRSRETTSNSVHVSILDDGKFNFGMYTLLNYALTDTHTHTQSRICLATGSAEYVNTGNRGKPYANVMYVCPLLYSTSASETSQVWQNMFD